MLCGLPGRALRLHERFHASTEIMLDKIRALTSRPIDRRTVVITGGASGIGRAVALLVGRRGDQVAILDRNEEAAAAVAKEVGGEQAIAICCDVGKEDQVERAFTAIDKRFGSPYGLFANAGN